MLFHISSLCLSFAFDALGGWIEHIFCSLAICTRMLYVKTGVFCTVSMLDVSDAHGWEM